MHRRFKIKPIHCFVLAALSPVAFAQSSTGDDAAAKITIFGSGQTRQVDSISREDVAKSVPGSSPLAIIEKLPGVNFQSSDALGAYEWSTRLTIRGFNQNQLGFTLDDVPLGDMSYANYNGLHISRAISTENIGRVTLSQGTGALDTASTSNLGGTVQFYSADPSDKRTFSGAQTIGTDSARRTFVGIDTGLMGNTKVALSFTDESADKWRGSGSRKQQQFNSKLVSTFGENRLSAFVNYSDRKEADDQDMSKEMLSRLGWNWDNYALSDWQSTINSAKSNWTKGETSMDDAYGCSSGLRKDTLAGATFDAKANDHTNWKTTVYHHHDRGAGTWCTPYVTGLPTAVPVAMRTTEYEINRSGIMSALTFTTGIHELNAGFWVEDNTFDQARRFYAVGLTSIGLDPFTMGWGTPLLTQWQYQFKTKTLVFHAQDTVTVSDRLTVNFGFKSPKVKDDVSTIIGTQFGSIEAKKTLLPQAGLNFDLDKQNELFASAAKNMRAFAAKATDDAPFATSAAGFAAIKDTLKPETSTTFEAGWRHHDQSLETVVSIYHTDFHDRIVGIKQGIAIEGNPTVLGNVGKVQTNGAEAGVSWTLDRSWNWLNSISYNDSQYKDDFTSNGSVVAVSGKQVVDSPKVMFKSELAFDNHVYFARIGANYIDKRYYTYLNDNSVDAYTLFNLSAGYRNIGGIKDLNLQLNVSNLFDKKYISTVGSAGLSLSDPTGTGQTLLPGAPRQVFITLSGKI
jgi:iron complex outermembrane receptor protein